MPDGLPARKLSPVCDKSGPAGSSGQPDRRRRSDRAPGCGTEELLENAVDGGARAIDIELGAAALRSFRSATTVAVSNPATAAGHRAARDVQNRQLRRSRIGRQLWFRGEALASIASVARLAITSRTQRGQSAFRLKTEGGTSDAAEPVSARLGTTVTVAELFFNTPARRRFLKSGIHRVRALPRRRAPPGSGAQRHRPPAQSQQSRRAALAGAGVAGAGGGGAGRRMAGGGDRRRRRRRRWRCRASC